ncbi:MAG TPA: CRISPR-associated protein Cas4 [Chloroflexia bacterium]|nr:CRISPR-associated protein Cas4 [Chloroflexia bacterium]
MNNAWAIPGWEASCLGGGVLLLGLAILLLVGSAHLRKRSGLPGGRILLSDTSEQRRGKPLYSETYGLAGTPDYLVQTSRGIVPVEVKPGRTDAEPQESHLLQVLAYCLLVEETEGQRPPYGLLRYSGDTFKVDYNNRTRAYIIEVIEEMRAASRQAEVHRSHESAGRCRACAYKHICEESLWPSE